MAMPLAMGGSVEVGNDFAKVMEDSLLTNLLNDGDSTGVAHLAGNTTIQSQTVNRSTNREGIEVPAGYLSKHEYVQKNPWVKEELNFEHFLDDRYKYGCGTFTDPRDGEVYQLACIGDQVWFAENLRYAGAGVCYDNDPSNCEKHGRLYTIDEATARVTSDANPSEVQGICPDGWHVPSKAESEELIDFAGGSAEAVIKLRPKDEWPAPNENTNELGFNLLPSGYFVQQINNGHAEFEDLGIQTFIWSSSESTGYHYAFRGAGLGYYGSTANLIWKFSCRCVKD